MELQKEMALVAEWIASEVESRHKDGVVIGLSGGIDSSVSATLAVQALGAEKVFGLIMPCWSQPTDREDAELVAQHLGIKMHVAELGPAYVAMQTVSPVVFDGNTRSRLRMAMLYGVAMDMNRLVLGTTNYPEFMTGYFTKWGDGAVDIEPLTMFYKWEVFEMGRILGLPGSVLQRVPTAGYTAEQTDEGEIGLTYPELDEVLGFIREFPQEEMPSVKRVVHVMGLIARSAHKRESIPFFHRF